MSLAHEEDLSVLSVTKYFVIKNVLEHFESRKDYDLLGVTEDLLSSCAQVGINTKWKSPRFYFVDAEEDEINDTADASL